MGTSSQDIANLFSGKLHIQDLTQDIERVEDGYIGGGGFGDVYRGRWKGGFQDDAEHPPLAIKMFRTTAAPDKSSLDRWVKVFVLPKRL